MIRFLQVASIILVFFSGLFAQNTKVPFKLAPSEKQLFIENQTIVSEIKFTGLDSDYEHYPSSAGRAVYESDFLHLLRENKAAISPGEKFDSKKVEKIIRLLKEWLAGEGYIKAEVTALGEKLPKNGMSLTFAVKRDDIVRVSEIVITGNYTIPAEMFINEIKTRSGDEWQVFDRRKYDYYASSWLRGLMYGQGFFKARILGVRPKFRGGSYSVTIAVDEGVRYRIGKIKIAGSTIFNQKELLEWSGQQPGDIADGKKLQDFAFEKLKRRYLDQGFLLYNAEFDPEMIEPEAKGLDGTVNVALTIEEGPQFKLGNILFSGTDDRDGARELEELLEMKKGEVFSQSALEKGIKKINEKKKDFRELDVKRDVEFGTPVTGGLPDEVNLIIKLRKP
jgi:outer membrane protein assembly factor BamA